MLSTTSQKAKAYKASDSLYSKKQHKKWATALMVATAAAAAIRVTGTHHGFFTVMKWQESGVTRRDKCCFESNSLPNYHAI
jgi:hypothetical protein